MGGSVRERGWGEEKGRWVDVVSASLSLSSFLLHSLPASFYYHTHTHTHTHLVLRLGVAKEALMLAMVKDGNGKNQERVNLKPLVKEVDAAGHFVEGNNDVLHHVLVDDFAADLGGHG